jgi:AraC-like DNA-binding protein
MHSLLHPSHAILDERSEAADPPMSKSKDLSEKRPGLARAEIVGPALSRVLAHVQGIPAYVTGARFDVLDWNDAAAALYRCDTIPKEDRNTLLFLFTQPEVRKLIVSWEEEALRTVHAYRRSVHTGSPWVDAIFERLMKSSADFRRIWSSTGAPAEGPFRKEFQKRGFGRLVFDVQVAAIEGPEPRRLHLYSAADDVTEQQVKRLVKAYLRRKGSALHAKNLQRVRRVQQYLDENYAETAPLDTLAKLVGLDKFHLVRIFAREVGMPPHAYQILVRVERVRFLLSAGASLADAAADVGFSDQSHMAQHFRRVEGITPAVFQRLGRAAPPSRKRR